MLAYDRISRWTEHNLRKHLWVLLAYIALSLVLTWPLAAHFATHVPGDGIDDPSLAWNLWWVKHALVDHPQNPFLVDWQFWPVGINLAFYTLTVLNGMLGIPLQVVFGVIPTYNLLLLASFALSGFGAYLLCLSFVDGGRRTEDEGRSVLPSIVHRPSSALSSAARCSRSRRPSCSTRRWARATSPARNGCRSRRSTSCGRCAPRGGCAMRLWPPCSSCSRPMPN